MGDINRPKDPEVLKLDLTSIDLADESVDVVFCNHVLEHVPNDSQAMSEVLRVLKPGGFALFMVPLYIDLETSYENPAITTPRERLKHFDQEDHVRKYEPRDFKKRLQQAGFSVQVFPLAEVPQEKREYLGMAGHDDNPCLNAARGADIYLCNKN